MKLEDYENKIYPVKKDSINDINVEFRNVQMNFEAPVDKNTKVGELVLRIGNEEIIDSNISITNYIERKNIKDYVFECLESII